MQPIVRQVIVARSAHQAAQWTRQQANTIITHPHASPEARQAFRQESRATADAWVGRKRELLGR